MIRLEDARAQESLKYYVIVCQTETPRAGPRPKIFELHLIYK